MNPAKLEEYYEVKTLSPEERERADTPEARRKMHVSDPYSGLIYILTLALLAKTKLRNGIFV